MQRVKSPETQDNEIKRMHRRDDTTLAHHAPAKARPAAGVAPLPGQINLSDRATLIGGLDQPAAAPPRPDVRQQRIESLRQLIKAGSYRPSAGAITEAILKDQVSGPPATICHAHQEMDEPRHGATEESAGTTPGEPRCDPHP